MRKKGPNYEKGTITGGKGEKRVQMRILGQKIFALMSFDVFLSLFLKMFFFQFILYNDNDEQFIYFIIFYST